MAVGRQIKAMSTRLHHRQPRHSEWQCYGYGTADASGRVFEGTRPRRRERQRTLPAALRHLRTALQAALESDDLEIVVLEFGQLLREGHGVDNLTTMISASC